MSVEKQIYYCFGCHEGGNAVAFSPSTNVPPFRKPSRALRTQLGIQTRDRTGPRRTPVFDALSKTSDLLPREPETVRTRSESTLRTAVSMDRLSKTSGLVSAKGPTSQQRFAKRLGMPLDTLFSSGILKMREGGEKLMISFAEGMSYRSSMRAERWWDSEDGLCQGRPPKYINSPESPVFSKRSVLYGLDKAKREIAEKRRSHHCGRLFRPYLPSCGRYSPQRGDPGHVGHGGSISRLRNHTENITLMLDGDEAGVKSALRLITLFGEMGINGNMVVLPDGLDPDSLMRREGRHGFLRGDGGQMPCSIISSPSCEETRPGDPRRDARFHTDRSSLSGSMKDTGKEKALRSASIGAHRGRGIQVLGQMKRNAKRPKPARGWVGKRHRAESRGHSHKQAAVIESSKKRGWSIYQGQSLGELASRVLDYCEDHRILDLKIFLNVLEKPELRDMAISSAMDVAECDEQEMDKILSDYLQHAENRLIREEAKGITERLAEAEEQGDEKSLIELLEKKNAGGDSHEA